MKRADVAAALLDVRALVARAWTKDAYCCIADGKFAGATIPFTSKLHDQPERTIAYCLAGACDVVAARRLLDAEELRAKLVAELPRRLRIDDFALEHWNDRPERTRDDVLALVDGALRRVGYVRGLQLVA